MLTEDSYLNALWVYALAAIAVLVMFNLWFLPAGRWWLRVLLTLPLAALLLTPALIAPGARHRRPRPCRRGFSVAESGPRGRRPRAAPPGAIYRCGGAARPVADLCRGANAEAPTGPGKLMPHRNTTTGAIYEI